MMGPPGLRSICATSSTAWASTTRRLWCCQVFIVPHLPLKRGIVMNCLPLRGSCLPRVGILAAFHCSLSSHAPCLLAQSASDKNENRSSREGPSAMQLVYSSCLEEVTRGVMPQQNWRSVSHSLGLELDASFLRLPASTLWGSTGFLGARTHDISAQNMVDLGRHVVGLHHGILWWFWTQLALESSCSHLAKSKDMIFCCIKHFSAYTPQIHVDLL